MALASPRASARGVELPPVADRTDLEAALERIQAALALLVDGKTNATGTVTLRPNRRTTTVADRRVGPDSHIDFTPITASAAIEIGQGRSLDAASVMHVSHRANQGFTITHADNDRTDRTFTYGVRGP